MCSSTVLMALVGNYNVNRPENERKYIKFLVVYNFGLVVFV